MTPKSFSNLIFGVLIVFCFVQYGSQTIQDGCPSITVKRNHILRTKYSMRMGAKYIRTLAVDKAQKCYKACCDLSSCNLALLQYRNDSHGGIKRTCYLFDCGNPSKCSYAPLEHHAAIVFKRSGLVGGKEDIDNFIPITTTTEPKTKSLAQELNCPPNVPVAMCLKNPCEGAVCPAYPSATCKPNLCGGCFAHFYDELDERVSCKVVKATKPPKSVEEEDLGLVKKIKQSFQQRHKKPASTSSDSFKNQLHKMPLEHISHASEKQNLYDIDDSTSTKSSQSAKEKESIERKLEEISPHREKPAEEEELEHEQRVWPDNNPNYPNPPHKKTDEPLDHEQRQWPDNNPNFSELSPHKNIKVTTKSTTKASTKPRIKLTTKPTIKSTTKPTTVPAPKVIPKTVPKPAPKQTAQPVVIIDKGKGSGPQRMNVTMVIEDNRVHFVENKAVLPLAIFLVIAILLLFVVALRLRIIKSKLKRRPFATEDADYLINGMYL